MILLSVTSSFSIILLLLTIFIISSDLSEKEKTIELKDEIIENLKMQINSLELELENKNYLIKSLEE